MKEIALKFDRYAKEVSSLSYRKNQLKRAIAISRYINKEDKVLEVGCGDGNILETVDSKKVIGTDISLGMIMQGMKKYKKINFVNSDAENLPFKQNSFDKIIISEVLYYLEDAEKCIKECSRCLKKNGKVVIVSLNSFWLWNFMRFFTINKRYFIRTSGMKFSKLVSILKSHLSIEEKLSLVPRNVKPEYSRIYMLIARKE